jgi:hypothetical protein
VCFLWCRNWFYKYGIFWKKNLSFNTILMSTA